APIAFASSSARSSARYSATLFVNSPMYSPISASTLPCASLITTPIAEGPGLPRDPPSTISTRSLLAGDIEDAAAVLAGVHVITLPRRVEHRLRDRHVAGIADRAAGRRGCPRPPAWPAALWDWRSGHYTGPLRPWSPCRRWIAARVRGREAATARPADRRGRSPRPHAPAGPARAGPCRHPARRAPPPTARSACR